MNEQMRANPVAVAVFEAQRQFHKTVESALAEFTTSTGLSISDVRWQLAQACDTDGHVVDAAYYGVTSTLVGLGG